jgi:hypothetical protein
MASIEITDCPRTFTKPMYKLIWRQYRIAANKALKASTEAMRDLMIYGTAIVRIEGDKVLNVSLGDYFK